MSVVGAILLHINELVLAINNAGDDGATYRVRSSFEPMRPMLWAESADETEKVRKAAA